MENSEAGRCIGYVRVSTTVQSSHEQIEALRKIPCVEIFEDRAIANDDEMPPSLKKALDSLKSGDTLVVARLDRLSRSVEDAKELVFMLANNGIATRALYPARYK